MDESNATQLFAQVIFTIIPDDKTSETAERQIAESAVSHGARYLPCEVSTSALNLRELTHIISTHVDFPHYLEALDKGITVITPAWIHDTIAKRRQATPRQYSPDPSQFFRDVILTVGTLPESDENAIIAGVLALGGQWSDPLTKIVTHIVTTDIGHEKCVIASDKKLPLKIVLPHWFDDCLKLGRKISEQPYELPHPEVLRVDSDRPVRINASHSIQGASTSTPDADPNITPPVSPSKPRKGLNAFAGKQLYLSKDLKLHKHLENTLCSLIERAGGNNTEQLKSADIYIGRYREHEDFVDAFLQGKIIANLSWLYHVLNRNRWTNPTSRLLHYPVPRSGLPGFDGLRISLSNYTGDARVYVQSLIQECGATFTKTMRQDNTHLITAHRSSEKCEAAQEWNINMINHIWLEESYARCAVQTLTNPKYTHFPPRTNLGEVCGQICIDEDRIHDVYVLPVLRKREAVTVSVRAVQEGPSSEDEPLVSSPPPAIRSVSSPSEQTNNRRAGNKNDHPNVKATTTPRFIADGKENESPFQGSHGRASKIKAMGALHQQADDIALFQKEMKRKGGVTHGGRQPKEPLSKSTNSKKRLSEDASFDESADIEELSFDETQPTEKMHKKIKTAATSDGTLPPIKYRMMVTGDDRWTGHPQKESTDKTKLRQLGVLLTTDPKAVDILVAKSIIRTRKFVSAIARAPRVVGLDYLDVALSKNRLLDNPPLLVDEKAEEEYGFKLAESLERAKANKGRLFNHWEIYISDHLPGGFETYKDIIGANGGHALAFRGSRRGTSIKKRLVDPSAGAESQNQGDDDEYDFAYFVATDTAADKALWKQFRDIAKEQGLRARVVKADWLLLAALTQRVRWDAKWEWPEFAAS